MKIGSHGYYIKIFSVHLIFLVEVILDDLLIRRSFLLRDIFLSVGSRCHGEAEETALEGAVEKNDFFRLFEPHLTSQLAVAR